MLSEPLVALRDPEDDTGHPMVSDTNKTQDAAAPITWSLDCAGKSKAESIRPDGSDQDSCPSCPEAGNLDVEAANFLCAFQSMAYAEAKVSTLELWPHSTR